MGVRPTTPPAAPPPSEPVLQTAPLLATSPPPATTYPLLEGALGYSQYSDGRHVPIMSGVYFRAGIGARFTRGAGVIDYGVTFLHQSLTESKKSTESPGTDNRAFNGGEILFRPGLTSKKMGVALVLDPVIGGNTFRATIQDEDKSANMDSEGEPVGGGDVETPTGAIHIDGYGTPKNPGFELGGRTGLHLEVHLTDHWNVYLEPSAYGSIVFAKDPDGDKFKYHQVGGGWSLIAGASMLKF